jgi:hypothetical protein
MSNSSGNKKNVLARFEKILVILYMKMLQKIKIWHLTCISFAALGTGKTKVFT